jgi:hypothetical protein
MIEELVLLAFPLIGISGLNRTSTKGWKTSTRICIEEFLKEERA